MASDQKKSKKNVLNAEERKEVSALLAEDNVVGYAVFDDLGEIIEERDIAPETVAVFSNILDMARATGIELGESDPRPALTFSKRDVELFTLPLSASNILVAKSKTSRGYRREFRHGS